MAAVAAPQSRVLEIAARPLTSASLIADLVGPPSASGLRISEETALRVSDVYKCVNVLSQSVAMLSLPVYRRLSGGGKERATNHPLYAILHDAPNPWMTSYDLRATLMAQRALWGNAFAEIQRDAGGQVTGLYPLRPDRMERPVQSQAGSLVYPYCLPNGDKRNLPQANVLHLRGLSSDGIWGYSVIRQAAHESIGLAKAAEMFGGKLFANGARPGGVLETDNALSKEAADRLAATWNQSHQGLDNAHRVAVLEEGVKYHAITIPPNEAQWMETRKYQRSEIAGLYRVPLHLIGDLERATFSNIEQQALEFVVHTLTPWLVSWEQAINQTLFVPSDRGTFYAEFLVETLLRGDSAARAQFYTSLSNLGALSPNDIREKENLNPIEGGDRYFVPLNMVPLDQAGQPQQEGGDDDAEAKATMQRDLAIGRSLLNIERHIAQGFDDLAELEYTRLRDLYSLGPAPMPEPPEPEPVAAPTEGEGNDEPQQNALRAGERRSLSQRQALRSVYAPIIKQAVGRVTVREVDGIREQLDGQPSPDFLAWLERFEREVISPRLASALGPILRAYGAAVEREVLDELDIPTLSESLEPFLERYTASVVETYTGRSVSQMRNIAAKTPPDELQKAIEERLGEWLEKRASKVARIESVRTESAVTHTTYRRAGVQRVKWQTRGKDCPYCARLDGRVVGIADPFVPADSALEGGEGDPPMRIRQRKSHPPAHATCDCGLVKE